jgi:hypothetical protein
MFRDTVRTVLCEQQESMDPTAVLDFLTACIHIPRLWQVSDRNLSLTQVLWIRIRIILEIWIRIASNKKQDPDQHPDPHKSDKLDPDPDPHQFADDKPKIMEYEPI